MLFLWEWNHSMVGYTQKWNGATSIFSVAVASKGKVTPFYSSPLVMLCFLFFLQAASQLQGLQDSGFKRMAYYNNKTGHMGNVNLFMSKWRRNETIKDIEKKFITDSTENWDNV